MKTDYKSSKPRKEDDVRDKISAWLHEYYKDVEIQKEKYAKLIEETGEKKIIDASLIGRYKKDKKKKEKKDLKKEEKKPEGVIIAELEFEEHQASYSVLKDKTKITALLRKLAYWRADIPQYWIKIDKDGTPFVLNFRYIYENRNKLVRMGRYRNFTKPNQLIRIVAAEKDEEGNWPDYVLIGWDKLFDELSRIIKLAGFK
jgi:hypothetical protein